MHRNAVSSSLYPRRTDTEAGRAELPAYCRGIMNPALRPLLLRTRVPQLGKRMQFAKIIKQRLSKDTGRRHLLAEVVLVLADRAVPPADSLVLADHDVLGNLVEETEKQLAREITGAQGGTYRKSWETTTTPPLKALMASARESMVGISRPLVGSSSNSMLGPSIARRAKTIRDF